MLQIKKYLFLFGLLLFCGLTQAQSDSMRLQFQQDPYFKKLDALNGSIPVFYNTAVKAEIQSLLKNVGQKTSELIGKSNFALKHLGPYFDSLGLPPELALLAVVNSQFQTQFVDPSTGASGVWPLTFSTAKRYKLITNSFVDQRRNLFLSAHVTANYLLDLERIYQDWHFAISAFYAGPINLNMAIRKAGNTLVYENVHLAMDEKQRSCLEKFMALQYIIHFASEHKLTEHKFTLPTSDTVCTSIALSLDFIADKLEIKPALVRQLNPDYLEAIVPLIPGCNCFRLPKDKVDVYRDNREVFEVKPTDLDTTLPPPVPLEGEVIKTPTGVPVPATSHSSEPKLIYYTVKSGDNLGLLSKLFDCSMNDIKRWNSISGTMLYAGAKLKMYVPGNKVEEYKRINSMSASQKQALARRK